MSRGIKDLRELINISRLSFREDEALLEVSCFSLPEVDVSSVEDSLQCSSSNRQQKDDLSNRGTRSAPVDRTAGTSHRREDAKQQHGESLSRTEFIVSPAKKEQRVQKKGIDEDLVAKLDMVRLRNLLVRSNSDLAGLSAWWFDSRNACEFIHFWLKKLADAKQFELLQMEYSLVRKEIQSAFAKQLDAGDVRVVEVYNLLHSVLHEYPDGFCGPRGKYFTVGVVEILSSGKNEEFRTLLTNVRHQSTNKPIIEAILAIRSFGLISLINAIVCFFCEAHKFPLPSPEDSSRKIGVPNPHHVLQTAISLGYLDVVKYQWNKDKEHFFNVDVQGRSAIFLAVQHQEVKILQFILEKSKLHAKLDVNRQSHSGNTPLHAAVTAGDEGCVRLLLDAGADLNQWNPEAEGATPLHLAVMYGHEAIVHLLLDKGAATDVRMGLPATKTPMDIARDFEHENIVLLLTKYRK